MEYKKVKSKIFLFLFFITSCAPQGDNLFIRNFSENEKLLIYKYQRIDSLENLEESTLNSEIKMTKDILNKKHFAPVFKTVSSNFDSSLKVSEIDIFTFNVNIPAKTSVWIEPIYNYDMSFEYVLVNKIDSFNFNGPNQDTSLIVKNNNQMEYHFKFITTSYYLLDLK